MTRPNAKPQAAAPANDQRDHLQLGAVQIIDVVSEVVHALDRDGGRVQMVMERTPTVCADSGKLTEVTSNLLRNAIGSSPAGGIEVEVAARCLAPGHDGDEAERSLCEASVSVAIRERSPDSGQQRQVDEALMSAEKIVRLHQGRLWFASPHDEGRAAGFCLNSERAA